MMKRTLFLASVATLGAVAALGVAVLHGQAPVAPAAKKTGRAGSQRGIAPTLSGLRTASASRGYTRGASLS